MSGLAIRLDWDGRRVTGVEVAIDRPRAAQLFAGRGAGQVLSWLPRLYSLCGRAQGAAARLAMAAARDGSAGLDGDTRRALLIERVQEHLWRLLRDWPPLLGLEARDAEFAAWYRKLAEAPADIGAALAAYGEADIFGMPAVAWRTLGDRQAVAAWAHGGTALAPRLAAALLEAPAVPAKAACLGPALEARDFAAASWDADFPVRPDWLGTPAETGARARWAAHPLVLAAGNGLLSRLLARLLDLEASVRRLSGDEDEFPLADAFSPAENVGIARVDTARGLLLHRVELAGERVVDYAVVAPTEWNFHPRGAFAASIAELAAADEAALRNDVARWVTAFDPCVEWTMEVRHA